MKSGARAAGVRWSRARSSESAGWGGGGGRGSTQRREAHSAGGVKGTGRSGLLLGETGEGRGAGGDAVHAPSDGGGGWQ